ncbi:MAG: selenoprotein O, partial [Porphyrobacter sp.]|nr:selenoprotein O [Porphyrobacter sp.]
TAPLVAALERFGPLYMEAVARRWCWRLGVVSQGVEADTQLVAACEAAMRESRAQPDAFFFAHRGGRGAATGALAEALAAYAPVPDTHAYWSDVAPQTMLIDEVEAIWSAIDESDDWAPLHAKLAALARMAEAHGPPPVPAGHA